MSFYALVDAFNLTVQRKRGFQSTAVRWKRFYEPVRNPETCN